MRSLVRKVWHELDRDDINWDQEPVAFEFFAIACLANAAKLYGWNVKCSTLPSGIRMDSWCRFPAHSYGRFGRRTRHCKIEELVGVLTPRLVITGSSGQIYSLYYQGFPPKDVSGERPDWLVVPAKANIRYRKNEVFLSFYANSRSWEGIFGTLLGPYGPLKKFESGNLPLPCGIIEVSLSKDRKLLNKQISRYKKIYGDIECVGFLGCEVVGVKFPIITVPRSPKEGLNYEISINAGKRLFNFLLT